MTRWLLACLLSLPTLAAAQAGSGGSLSGTVTDSLSGQPLPFASVFLAGTTRGATADERGQFGLAAVPPGHYELTASSLGYRSRQQALVVGPGAALSGLRLRLPPAAQQLADVVVRPNPNRVADYQRFLELWLGTSTLARQCRVLDPNAVLVDFDPARNRLMARVAHTLQVDNPALGYRLTFHDFRFQADIIEQEVRMTTLSRVVFTELPGSAGQLRRRVARRRAAYQGSLMHFLRCVQTGQVGVAGYELHRLRRVPNRRRAAADSLLRARRAAGQLVNQGSLPDSVWALLRQPRELTLLFQPALAPDSLRRGEGGGPVELRFRDLLAVRYRPERPDYYFRPPAPPGTPPPAHQESVLRLTKPPAAALDASGVLLDPLAVYVEGYWAFEAVGELLPLDYRPPAAGAADQ